MMAEGINNEECLSLRISQAKEPINDTPLESESTEGVNLSGIKDRVNGYNYAIYFCPFFIIKRRGKHVK